MSRSIGLIGMMGSGKTTVARLLGARLGRGVIDTDAEIVRWRDRRIPAIFAEEGEAAFRAYEARVIEELATLDDVVISLGGGAPLTDGNVAHFLLTGVLVYLAVPPEELVRRLVDEDGGRPLLDVEDPAARIRELHAERDPRYREVADAVVDGDDAPADVTDEILDWLRESKDVLTPGEFERIMHDEPSSRRSSDARPGEET